MASGTYPMTLHGTMLPPFPGSLLREQPYHAPGMAQTHLRGHRPSRGAGFQACGSGQGGEGHN